MKCRDMDESDQDGRRRRLRAWMNQHCNGVEAELARRVGKSPTQISDTLAGRKPFGEKLARSIEAKLKMPRKALDSDGPPTTELSSPGAALLTLWRRLTKRQQAALFEQIEATAASNIEIAEHLGKDGAGIKRIVLDGEVEERYLRNADKPGGKKPKK
jgi:hypothetical protein